MLHSYRINLLTLVNAGEGGGNHHPLSENRVFSTTEHPVNPKLVFNFEFARFGQVEKNRALNLP